jgi:Mrp family chromosome partitioning ATPase
VARAGSDQPLAAAQLERSLDGVIERLSSLEQTPQVRALRIEARRLRSAMANWRSIPPSPDVREAMLAKVLHVSAATRDIPAPPRPDFASKPNLEEPPEDEEQTVVYEAPVASLEEPSYVEPEIEPAPEPGPVSEAIVHVMPAAPPPDPRARAALSHPGNWRGKEPRRSWEGAVTLVHNEEPAARPEIPVQAVQVRPVETHDPRAQPPGPGARPQPIEVHHLAVPEVLDPRVVMLQDPYSPAANAYRDLRRRLVATEGIRTVAITSAGPKEGKTTSAINLALALRDGARGRVLLIDANLRAPGIASLLGFEPPDCFSQQVGRHKDNPDATWNVVEQVPPLHVLAINPKSARAPLFDPVAFGIAMERLKSYDYEFIVVDAPAVLGGTDVNLIADCVDGVILTAITMSSKSSAMREAINQLKPAPILGAIVLES